MIGARKNMSETPVLFPQTSPLHLDFFQPGSLRRPANGDIHRKTTPYTILVQTLEGRYRVRCRGKVFDLPPGRAALIPAHSPVEFGHYGGTCGIIRSHWVHFRFSYLGLVDFLSFFETPLQLPRSCSGEIRRLVAKALRGREEEAGEPLRSVSEYALASRLLELVCRVSRQKEEALERLEKQKLRPVLHHIHSHLEQPLRIGTLARRAGLSPSRFHACFLEEFHLSPMRYVKQARLEKAARLLAGSGFKLERIAEACGFADAFHLSHVFKRQYGMSPKTYRIQAKD